MAEGLFADQKFDYVINLCGETRLNLPESDYKQKCLTSATTAATAALAHGIKKWVEVSHGCVYAPADSKNCSEDAKLGPWTIQATYRLQAETAVREIKGLPVVTLRPAIVYGPGDVAGLCPRICTAAVYKALNKKMEMLWSENLKLNTVHVRDVCAAIWVCCKEAAAGSIYNLSDPGDTTQGKINKILGNVFNIKTGYLGMIINAAARASLPAVAERCNNDHLPTWKRLTDEAKISNTPISPYLAVELLMEKNIGIDGAKITRDTSFRYSAPAITEALVQEQLNFHIAQGLFPVPAGGSA